VEKTKNVMLTILWHYHGDVDDYGDDVDGDGGDECQLAVVLLHILLLRDDDGDNNADDIL
jgi:hypothetical protein